MTDDEPAVIAAAGGSVLDPANRRLIRRAAAGGGLVVWLDAPADVLARRVRTGTHRPLLEHDPPGALTRLAAERDPLYREVADLHLDADAEPAAIVDQIQAQLAVPSGERMARGVTPVAAAGGDRDRRAGAGGRPGLRRAGRAGARAPSWPGCCRHGRAAPPS